MASYWDDDEIVAKLKKLWADGLSASQCAKALPGTVSRNAVISKLYRLGLTGFRAPGKRPTSSQRLSRAQHRAARKKIKTPGLNPARSPVRAPWHDMLSPTEAVDIIPDAAPTVGTLELEEHHCRWPLGDPRESSFGYCGADKIVGIPYCLKHARRAFAPRAVATGTILSAGGQNQILGPAAAPEKTPVSAQPEPEKEVA